MALNLVLRIVVTNIADVNVNAMVRGNVLGTPQKTSVTRVGSVTLTVPSTTRSPNLNLTENVGTINASVFVTVQLFVLVKQLSTRATSQTPA